MNENKRPHSRKKTYGSGSAGVSTGHKVDTGGHGPVGSGEGPGGSGGGFGGGKRDSGGSPFGQFSMPKMSLKSMLTLIIVVLLLFFLLKNCGGMDLLSGLMGGMDGQQNNSAVYDGDATSSDTSPDLSVSNKSRAKRVNLLGDGKDTVTIMVYMCGTDLESRYGMATRDLQEMANATISDKVNIIVETGGCKKWKTSGIANDRNQIYKVEKGTIKRVEDNFGNSAMTDPKNLTTFIKYCASNYPANRNILIFWDHGGGSLAGFGYDEKNPRASSMPLNKINSALSEAKTTFDFIGFDACLMATLETALVCNEYADYMIASEESEPGTGWYYTNWLTKLSENTSISTVDLAQTLIDDFISASRQASPNATVTLSVVDLAELNGTVPDAFSNFATSTTELIKSDNYKQVADARAGVRQFAQQSRINQVDLVDLADRIGTKDSKALSKALKECVKYNRSSISRCYGLSIYFPYETTSSVSSAVASYNALGMDDDYTKCIQSFASLEYGGQIAGSASQFPSSGGGDLLSTLLGALTSSGSSGGSGSANSPLGSLFGAFLNGGGSASASSQPAPSAGLSISPSTIINLLGGLSGRSMPSGYEWVDTQLIADNAQNISENYIDASHITVTEKNGKKVLALTEKEWSLISTVELNVFVNDGKGLIDLGLDNTFDWTEDNDKDLIVDFDGTWLTLNGNVCAYYLVSDNELADGTWKTIGRIPAMLNGQLVNLQVIFDEKDNVEGTVTGAYPMYDDDAIGVEAKGDIAINEGDTITLICDYYNTDGSYSASYTLGESFKVPADGLVLRNLKLDASDIRASYRLTDIYGNHYWLPVSK
ncbi:MAG: peptidase C11 [Clostridia bacterium]|nr:peptidase C11 [Clostridia bacterium]